jgi:ubiquinone biosynthesis protein UbiJ
VPDLTLSISPLKVPTLLAHPERWSELVAAEGDAALAATLSDLARTLPWFVEEALAGVLGPLIGTRVAEAGRALLELPGHATRSFGASMRAYVRDEAGVGVGPDAFAVFSAEVAATATRVDALLARLDQAVEARSAKAPAEPKPR